MTTSTRDATQKEIQEWSENDYFRSMNFNPTTLLIVVPTIIQIVVLGFLAASIYINSIFIG